MEGGERAASCSRLRKTGSLCLATAAGPREGNRVTLFLFLQKDILKERHFCRGRKCNQRMGKKKNEKRLPLNEKVPRGTGTVDM